MSLRAVHVLADRSGRRHAVHEMSGGRPPLLFITGATGEAVGTWQESVVCTQLATLGWRLVIEVETSVS
jgi:hypothetical protein